VLHGSLGPRRVARCGVLQSDASEIKLDLIDLGQVGNETVLLQPVLHATSTLRLFEGMNIFYLTRNSLLHHR
jgi:hypothetical protein